MKTKQPNYGMLFYQTQSSDYLNPASIFILSSLHSSHHHGHSAH